MSIGTLTITLRSPFLIGGEEQISSAIDAVTMRDACGTHAIVPGSVIKGVLRDALCGLAALGHPEIGDLPREWFGVASGAAGKPERGRLAFGDLVSTEAVPTNPSFYARVAIDSPTGSAREGALQLIDLPWPVGKTVTFTGAIHGDRALLDDKAIALIKQALLAIPALGSMRGIGFGRLVAFDVKREISVPKALPEVKLANEQDLLLRIRFDGPFVVASDRPDDNSFAGSEVVPGAALKGAIADRLSPSAAAMSGLTAITIHHGLPVHRDAPLGAATIRVLPASLALVPGAPIRGIDAKPGDKYPPSIVDMTQHYDDLLIDRGDGQILPMHFADDWKQADAEAVYRAIAEANGWSKLEPRRDQRTRAAIDGARGTSLASNLFSVEAVAPIDTKDNLLDWEFRLCGDAEPLQALVRDIGGVSLTMGKLKTGARVVEADIAPPVPRPEVRAERDRAATTILLTTPAILTRLARLEAAGGEIALAYASYFTEYFRDRVPGIRLDRFYAAQRLLTGYQALRFKSSESRFEPWIETKAGAVFCLSAPASEREELQELVALWSRFGLPPDGGEGQQAWATLPMARENGFGAIAAMPLKLPPLPPGARLLPGGRR